MEENIVGRLMLTGDTFKWDNFKRTTAFSKRLSSLEDFLWLRLSFDGILPLIEHQQQEPFYFISFHLWQQTKSKWVVGEKRINIKSASIGIEIELILTWNWGGTCQFPYIKVSLYCCIWNVDFAIIITK